jgi:hypothetical protein
MKSCLLTVIATPGLEERLVDWLLERGQQGFSTVACRGHGVHDGSLSAAEQVAGRQQRVAFWIQATESDAREIAKQLAADFGSVGLHHWIAPLLEGGPLVAPTTSDQRTSR